jgi:hypothetical protein
MEHISELYVAQWLYITMLGSSLELEVTTKPRDSSRSMSRTSRRFGENIGRRQNFDQFQFAIINGHVPNMSYNFLVPFHRYQ